MLGLSLNNERDIEHLTQNDIGFAPAFGGLGQQRLKALARFIGQISWNSGLRAALVLSGPHPWASEPGRGGRFGAFGTFPRLTTNCGSVKLFNSIIRRCSIPVGMVDVPIPA